MSRNFGIGSRDMVRAGRMILGHSDRSFSSKATLAERWGEFVPWARAKGIRHMEQIEKMTVIAYGEDLQGRVESGDLAPSTAQNYLSAVNVVMALATEGAWPSVSPTRDCGIEKRSGIATVSRAIPPERHEAAKREVCVIVAVLLDLQRSMGLRLRESCLINPKSALRQAEKQQWISVLDGTKGGRARQVPVSAFALEALHNASRVQGSQSMIPDTIRYVAFHRACYQQATEAGVRFHGERHAYAQERYLELSGAPAPIAAGWPRAERFQRMAEFLGVPEEEARQIDHTARLQVASELGHGRVEVSNAYLG